MPQTGFRLRHSLFIFKAPIKIDSNLNQNIPKAPIKRQLYILKDYSCT